MDSLRFVPYTESWTPAVRAFNRRLLAAGLEQDLQFPESHIPDWPAGAGLPIHREYYLAVAGADVRGTYLLTQEQWTIGGRVHSVAHFRLPISEGIANPAFKGVGPQLFLDAVKRQPNLYCLGMGGYDMAVPRRLRTLGWSMRAVPFYFKVRRARAFLRNIRVLRNSAPRRLLSNFAAATGLGPAAIHAVQSVRKFAARRPEAVRVELAGSFSGWSDPVWEDVRLRYGLASARDGRTLDLRYPPGEGPFLRLKISGPDGVIGYALLLDSRLCENKYFGDLRVGVLVDCLAAPERAPAVTRAAVAWLEKGGVDLTVSNQSHASWCAALRQCGFLKGPSNFIFAASPPLAAVLGPLETQLSTFHLNRADGPGPTRLMT